MGLVVFFLAWYTAVVCSTVAAHRFRWSIARFLLAVFVLDLAVAVLTTAAWSLLFGPMGVKLYLAARLR